MHEAASTYFIWAKIVTTECMIAYIIRYLRYDTSLTVIISDSRTLPPRTRVFIVGIYVWQNNYSGMRNTVSMSARNYGVTKDIVDSVTNVWRQCCNRGVWSWAQRTKVRAAEKLSRLIWLSAPTRTLSAPRYTPQPTRQRQPHKTTNYQRLYNLHRCNRYLRKLYHNRCAKLDSWLFRNIK